MSVADKVRAIYGIRRFLDKYEIGVNIEKDRNINPIFLEFAKSMGWEEHFKKSNKKGYRGKFEPSLCNAEMVSANFEEFKIWVGRTYKLRSF